MVIRGAGPLGELADVTFDDVAPRVPAEMVASLKFSVALPEAVAVKTLAERFADRPGARIATQELARQPDAIGGE
jgi:ATP-dependent Lhr-like helicase